MSPGVDDGSVPLPLMKKQQAVSSTAGLRDSVAEMQEAARKLETEEEKLQTEEEELETKKEKVQTERKELRDHIAVLTCCVREKKLFTTDNLGATVTHFLDIPPSEAVVRTMITKLEDRLHKLEDKLDKLEGRLKV